MTHYRVTMVALAAVVIAVAGTTVATEYQWRPLTTEEAALRALKRCEVLLQKAQQRNPSALWRWLTGRVDIDEEEERRR
jgi:RecB family exonuclease